MENKEQVSLGADIAECPFPRVVVSHFLQVPVQLCVHPEGGQGVHAVRELQWVGCFICD